MLTDGALLERYARYGDANAFAELGNRYSGLVFSACFRITGNAEDAKDASQECFLELARNAGRIRSSLPAWLHKVAMNKSSNIVRRACISKQREEEAAEIAMGTEESDWPEIVSHIDEAIDRLPGSIRLTLILHYLQGKTQEEVAKELGVNQATVSRRLERGIEGMRKHLRKAGLTVPASVLAGLLTDNSASAVPVALTAAIGKMAIAGIGSGGASAGGLAVSAIAGISAFVGTTVGKTVAVTGAAAVLAGVGFGIHELNRVASPPSSGPTEEIMHPTEEQELELRFLIETLREQEADLQEGDITLTVVLTRSLIAWEMALSTAAEYNATIPNREFWLGPLTLRYREAFNGDRFRSETQLINGPDGEVPAWYSDDRTTAFDGKRSYSHFPIRKTGSISPGNIHAIQEVPRLLTMTHIAGKPLSEYLKSEGAVYEGLSSVDDVECIKVTVPRNGGKTEIWISPAHGYRVKQVISTVPPPEGKPYGSINEYKVESFARYGEHWFPVNGNRTWFRLGDDDSRDVKIDEQWTVESYASKVPDEVFTIGFPPGTRIL